ncbi:MAG: hypothetical protein JWN27_3543 [Candidatus Eremiobacteraeota bacterium]|nr:hypothetical protein [Candidatus Eremiobacteraeota bacterium]
MTFGDPRETTANSGSLHEIFRLSSDACVLMSGDFEFPSRARGIRR